jgi:hypothetical protein
MILQFFLILHPGSLSAIKVHVRALQCGLDLTLPTGLLACEMKFLDPGFRQPSNRLCWA